MRGAAGVAILVLLAACGADGPPVALTYGATAERGPLDVTATVRPGGRVDVSGTVSVGISGGIGG